MLYGCNREDVKGMRIEIATFFLEAGVENGGPENAMHHAAAWSSQPGTHAIAKSAAGFYKALMSSNEVLTRKPEHMMINDPLA